MTASAVTWPDAPTTGLDALADILAAPPNPMSRAMWDLLHQAYPTAALQLAHVLKTSAQPRDDLSPRDLERIVLAWRYHAADVLEDLHRALINSPLTLKTLASGALSPVHGSERRALVATVTRRLLILGCVPNEVAERKITYAAFDAIRSSLLQMPHPAPRATSHRATHLPISGPGPR